jgi:PAS domain S-box-containing protein
MEMSKAIYRFMEDEMMRLLLSEVTDLTYIYDTEGNILFVNKIFEKFTGHRPEEFYGKPFSPLFDESNLKKAKDAYTRTLRGESPHCELSFKNTFIVCEYKSFPLRDPGGNIIGVMGIARDVTARKQGEERLRVLNESLEKRVAEHTARLVEINEELTGEINERKQLERTFKRSVEKLQRSLQGVIQSMALTVESKDPYGAGHQRRVARLACCIAEEMGLSKGRIEGISLAAEIHDIGKISIPAEVICKEDRLTEAECEMIKGHPRVGYDILKEIEFPWPVAQTVLQHHERVDGSGYPLGLSGKDIILEAKILGVADRVETLFFPHPQRNSIGLDKALDELSQNRGILYDSSVVHACMSVFHEKGFRFEEERHADARVSEDALVKV